MGWDETLFGWVYARARAIGAPRVSPAELARQATLESEKERLRVLGSLLAERPIEIREAENEGGFAGSIVLLPPAFRHAPSVQENEDAYVVRLVRSIAAMRLGLVLETNDPLARALATALAAPAIREEALALCPGATARMRAHDAHALRALPPARSRALRALTAVMRHRLGDASALGETALDPSAAAWVERALACRPRDARVLGKAVERLVPALRALGALRGEAPRVPLSWGWIGAPAHPSEHEASGSDDAGALPSGTELAGAARERIRRVELPRDPMEDNPLIHSFEKVHTAEEHRGGSKSADGSDELAKHEEALRELDLREVVRTTERAASLLRCDVMLESGAGDLAGDDAPTEGIPYDEWNEKTRAYRRGWCHVRVAVVPSRVDRGAAASWVSELRAGARKHVDAVRAELVRIELGRRWRARQLDGPEIDVDAIVDRHAALASGHTGTDRLHCSRPRAATELSVLLLLDASLSTDAWIANRRVLDVERESALVLADALEGLGVELGVATFHSHTRRDCRFDVVKGMSEPWSSAELRLASVEPAGYTRIGPALRHATRVLERAASRRRLLLLLTDAKPNDYDRYEGSYGIGDVRQAVREAERAGIHVHALAMDPRARLYLPRMFGASRHSAVASPDRLAEAVGRVCTAMRA